MKKLRLVVVMLTAFLVSFNFSACKKAAAPKDVVKSFYDAIIENDIDKAFEYVYYENPEDADEVKQLKEKYTFILSFAGGIKSYEILDEKIDGDNAAIGVKVVVGTGEENEDVVNLVKDNDEWKIDLGLNSDDFDFNFDDADVDEEELDFDDENSEF